MKERVDSKTLGGLLRALPEKIKQTPIKVADLKTSSGKELDLFMMDFNAKDIPPGIILDFTDLHLQAASFYHMTLDNYLFCGADLSNANFMKCSFKGTNFSGSKERATMLTDTSFLDGSLMDAIIDNRTNLLCAKLDKVICPQFWLDVQARQETRAQNIRVRTEFREREKISYANLVSSNKNKAGCIIS